MSEHAGMGCDGYQVGVIAVKVDLNQVAALPVEDPYGKQSAVTAFCSTLTSAGSEPDRSTPATKALPSASARAVHG